MLKIIKTLKIEVTQADLEKALKELIAKQDPTIVVDAIEFSAKRSGKDSIGIKVDAHFADEDEVEESPQAELPPEEPQEEEAKTPAEEVPFPVEEDIPAKRPLFG